MRNSSSVAMNAWTQTFPPDELKLALVANTDRMLHRIRQPRSGRANITATKMRLSPSGVLRHSLMLPATRAIRVAYRMTKMMIPALNKPGPVSWSEGSLDASSRPPTMQRIRATVLRICRIWMRRLRRVTAVALDALEAGIRKVFFVRGQDNRHTIS
jgi:hypothetical protein